jgi:plastocyanin
MKLKTIGYLVGLALLLTACATSATPEKSPAASTGVSAPATAKVTMSGMTFIPANLKVAVGTTVIWDNQDLAQHNVLADDNSFKSGLIAGGQTFKFTFQKAGLFHYYCGLHGGPGGKGMSGTIEVTP